MASKTVVELMEGVGGCGPFQVLIVPLCLAAVPMAAWSMLFMVFGAIEPDWWCQSRGILYNASRDLSFNNTDHDTTSIGNEVAEFGGWMDNSSFKRCAAEETDRGLCDMIIFDTSVKTVVSEFQLVCDLAWVPPMIFSAQMFGVLIGAFVAGQLSDNLGRKTTLVGIISVHAVLNLVAAFSVNWKMFTAMRALIGVTIGGIVTTSFAYPTEFIGTKWRAVVTSIPMWGLGSMSFSLLVWLIQDWKYVHIATSVCTALCLPAWIYLPESVRWLLVHGRVPEAQRVLRQVARRNGRKAPSAASLQHLCPDQDRSAPAKYTVLHLFSSWEAAKMSFLLGFVWLSFSMGYFGILYGTKDMKGDFYLNFALLSIAEVIPSMNLFWIQKYVGRRVIVCGSFSFCALSVLTVIPTMLLLPEEEAGPYVIGLCIAAKAGLNLGWSCITLFVAELYPTFIRNIALGFCNTIARVGGIVAPYVLSAGEPYVFFVIIGVFLTLTAIIPLFLRETKGKPLYDNWTIPTTNIQNTPKDEEKLELE